MLQECVSVLTPFCGIAEIHMLNFKSPCKTQSTSHGQAFRGAFNPLFVLQVAPGAAAQILPKQICTNCLQ